VRADGVDGEAERQHLSEALRRAGDEHGNEGRRDHRGEYADRVAAPEDERERDDEVRRRQLRAWADDVRAACAAGGEERRSPGLPLRLQPDGESHRDIGDVLLALAPTQLHVSTVTSKRRRRLDREAESGSACGMNRSSGSAEDTRRAGSYGRENPIERSSTMSGTTNITHPLSARAGVDTAWLGAAAGIVAGPLFLGLVLLNSWWSLDYLHGIGWKLFGGKSLPYPSCLALGPHGWMQIGAFFLTGALMLAFAFGLRAHLPQRRLSTAAFGLLALFGAALVTSSAKTDLSSVNGEDPSTVNGWIHGVSFIVAMPSILLATFVLGLALRGDPRWRPFAIASPLVGVALILSFAGGPHGQASFLGFLVILFGWILSLSLRLRRLAAERG
jgi:hypothetical protein